MSARTLNLLLAALATGGILLSSQAEAQGRRSSPKAASKPPASGPAARPGRASELDRFNKMSPEERQKVLNSLPPDRRKRLEERLQIYNQLSPAEQQKLRQQYNAFRQLPPAKQNALRKLYREFEQLPPDRRDQLRVEMQQLQKMSPQARRARMSNAEFRTKYTLSEQRVMADLLRTLPSP